MLILQGCGGGGASSDPAPTGGGSAGGVNPPPAVVPGNLLTSMPSNPYPAGSADAKNFNEINRIRLAGGFGAAVEDAVMTKAAAAHDNYMVLNITAGNPISGPHAETPGLPGFTGASPQDRCTAAAIGTSEQGRITCGEVRIGGSDSIDVLNVMGHYGVAPGHLAQALDFRVTRVGVHLLDDPIASEWGTWGHGSFGTIDMGWLTSNPGGIGTVDSDKVNAIIGIYPFNGMTGVGWGPFDSLTQYNAACGPNGENLAATAAGLVGKLCTPSQTILVQVATNNNTDPTVTSFSLRKDGDTQDWPSRRIAAGDPCCGPGTESTYSGAGFAFLLVTKPMDPNTRYTVNFKGQANGVSLSKTWSFTTGPESYSRMGG